MERTRRVSGVDVAPESTFEMTSGDAPSAADVRLDPVTAHGWRVSDGRLPVGDPFRLLAFVEWRQDVFEVMQLGAVFEWHRFDAMEAAIAHIVETSPQIALQRLHGELDWLR